MRELEQVGRATEARIDGVKVLGPVAVEADAAPWWVAAARRAKDVVGLLHDGRDPHTVEAHATNVVEL